MRPVEPIEIRTATGRKRPIYFGAKGRPLFGFYHPPREGPWRGVGVVLCPPIGTDRTRSDRTYRHLAERLADAGFACLRFDLFGTGDSGGDASAPGLLRQWLDDVGLAVQEVQARSGAQIVSLVGLRLGATLAMLYAAERGAVDSLVVWSPYVSGTGFVGETTKLHKLYLRIEPSLAGATPTQLDGEEALGMLLPRSLIDDLAKVDLLAVGRRPARRTLFIDGGNVQGRDALMGRLREVGADPELRSHPGHKFLITVSHRATVPEEILESIVEPSKVISDQYKPVTVATADGKLYSGMPVVSDGANLVLLLPDATRVTIPTRDIDAKKESSVSVMPAGLINSLTYQEIADLLALFESAPSAEPPAALKK